MGELTAHGQKVSSVFQLIGTLENDITKSIAWAFSQCPAFSKAVFDSILEIDCDPGKIRIAYQQYESSKGITDLEITDDDLFYTIIEAKRGWKLPGKEQLTMYSTRKGLCESRARKKVIISMSECSLEYAESYLQVKDVNGIPVKHISWKRLYEMASVSVKVSNHAQTHLLNELMEYLGGIMTMQQQSSNWVYVVSLSYDKAGDSELSFIDVVEKKGKYYHPYGIKGWPKEAPNYIAFRYGGKLQSIHHVERYVITKNVHKEIPEMPDCDWETDHFVYTLGPAIKPSKTVKTGHIYASGRKWAMLDLLLTSDTISEAFALSSKRMTNKAAETNEDAE